ncbi:MAG: TIGR03936 family radical SAM-associated protein [Tissierellales bacterium]
MKMRAKFSKKEDLIYISHLDLMRLFHRAFRRAEIPVKYSEGFNPHPQLSLATALALGVSSDGEYMDLELESNMEPEEFKQRMNMILPNGIKILKAVPSYEKSSLVSLIRWSNYIVKFNTVDKMTIEEITNLINDFLNKKELILTKEKKKGKKVTVNQQNVRERINELFPLSVENNTVILKTTLMTGSVGNIKPNEVVDLLKEYVNIKIEEDSLRLHRLDLFIEKDGAISLPI